MAWLGVGHRSSTIRASTGYIVRDEKPRCPGVKTLVSGKQRPCNLLFSEFFFSRPWKLRCPRCGTIVERL